MSRCWSAGNKVFGLVIVGLAVALAGAGCAARSAPGGEPLSEDQRITAEVVRILAEEEDIVNEDLEVETHNGVVVVSGVQADLEAVSEVLRRIARVKGVTEVVNRIRILR